jgi:hypothetical protein
LGCRHTRRHFVHRPQLQQQHNLRFHVTPPDLIPTRCSSRARLAGVGVATAERSRYDSTLMTRPTSRVGSRPKSDHHRLGLLHHLPAPPRLASVTRSRPRSRPVSNSVLRSVISMALNVHSSSYEL